MVFRVIVVDKVPAHAGRAQDKQRGEQGYLPLLHPQALPLVIEQAEAEGHRHHRRQKQGQQHGFQREQGQVFDDPGQLEKGIGLSQDHLVVKPHDRRIEHDIDKKVNTEPGEDHPRGRHPGAVEEQGKDQGTGNLSEDKGEKVGPRGEQDTSKRVGDCGGDDGHHRAEDHCAEGVDKKGNVDLQVSGNGDAQALERHTQRNHQGREHQHPGVPQLSGRVPPVGFGKGGCIQGSGFCLPHANAPFLL